MTRFLLASPAALFCCAATAQATVNLIDFDSIPGMPNGPGMSVPAGSQLSTQYLNSLGVAFASQAGYVAVVNHTSPPACPPSGNCPTVSMPNVMGGVRADGTMSYSAPITLTFFYPGVANVAGITDFVSIRGDMSPEAGATARMEAFNVLGQSLGYVTADDSDIGLTLAIGSPGIHSVLLSTISPSNPASGSIGFDNLQFDPVTPASEPTTNWLVLFGLGALALGLKRCVTMRNVSIV